MLCDRSVSEPEPEMFVSWTQAMATAEAKADQKEAPPLYARSMSYSHRAIVYEALGIIGPSSVRGLVEHTGLSTEAVCAAIGMLRRFDSELGILVERISGDGTKGNPSVWRLKEGA